MQQKFYASLIFFLLFSLHLWAAPPTTGAPNINFNSIAVKLLHFKAAVKFGRVELDWATAAEVNTSHYEVERSADGITFTKIAQLNAAGNTQELRNYHFADAKPLNGWQYYRLRQVDADGDFTYSPVVRIFYKHKHIIKRFGNPVSDVLQMELEFTAGTNAMLQIYDMNGQQVKTEKLKTGPVSVDMSRLSNGVYFVEVSTATETEKIRIVKQ